MKGSQIKASDFPQFDYSLVVSDEGQTLKMSAWKLFIVVNLHQHSW